MRLSVTVFCSRRFFLSLVSSLCLASASVVAADLPVVGAGGYFNLKVTSIKEARFRNVIKQQYDFSCGSAALATLLSFHYGRKKNEQEVFQAMFDLGDKELIETKGFSLLDMKRYLESEGLVANGYNTELDKLAEVGIPAIVLINTKGYMHFVVIKGLEGGEVLVGDPALGLKVYERAEFEKMWNGILFVVQDEIETAKGGFNKAKDWSVRRTAPFGTALSQRNLARMTILLPRPGDF